METPVDDRLRDEARRFNLRFTCEHCAHFAEVPGTCALGYPNEAHRGIELSEVKTVFFCKEFEHH